MKGVIVMSTKAAKKPMSMKKYNLLWTTRVLSWNAAIAVFAYTTYFCTDVLKLPAATIGWLLMLSKVFDGFSDVLVGYLIDRTHTRLGKARPYELGVIGYWGCGMILFAAPKGSVTFLLFFFFLMYNLRQVVFSTFLACGEPVYFNNSIPDKTKRTGTLSFSGIVSGIVTLVLSVLLPIFTDAAGTSQANWVILGLATGIPFILIGLIRFFFVPEIRQETVETRDKFSLWEGVKLLFRNKYVLLYCGAMLFSYIAYNLQSNSILYYGEHVLGDGALGSLLMAANVSGLVVIAIMPWGCKKLGMTRFVKVTMWIALAGCLLRLINPYNVIVQLLAGLMANCAIMPFWGLINAYLMDCMDYGEWQSGVRAEGIYSSIYGVATKIGIGIGMGAVGLVLGWFGYDGNLAVQPTSAVNAIISLFTILPAILIALTLICLHFYDVEKIMPKIREELAERRSKQ